jgi:hypothetical protein
MNIAETTRKEKNEKAKYTIAQTPITARQNQSSKTNESKQPLAIDRRLLSFPRSVRLLALAWREGKRESKGTIQTLISIASRNRSKHLAIPAKAGIHFLKTIESQLLFVRAFDFLF